MEFVKITKECQGHCKLIVLNIFESHNQLIYFVANLLCTCFFDAKRGRVKEEQYAAWDF